LKFRFRVAAAFCLAICACAGPPAPGTAPNTKVFIPTVVDAARSWHLPQYADAMYGLRPLQDGPPSRSPTLAIAYETVSDARAQGLPPEFLAATLLQESAYDPRVLSSAGAIGIAQFMPETAAGAGIDPFDPFDAIGGASVLLGSYVRGYANVYANPFTAALAAYNAGPGAVSEYHGVPPYAETRAYINDVIDRWAKITGYEKPIGGS